MKATRYLLPKKNNFAYLFIIFTICLLTVGLFFLQRASMGLDEERLNYLMELSSKSAQNIEKQIKGTLTVVETLAAFIANNGEFEVYNALKILKENTDISLFQRIGIILPNGVSYSTDYSVHNFSDREYFRKAINGEKNVSDCIISKIDGKDVIVFATPIYQYNNIVGVVYATNFQENLSSNMEIENFHGEGNSIIIDIDGNPIITTIDNAQIIGSFDNYFESLYNDNESNAKLISKLKDDMVNNRNCSLKYTRDGIRRQLWYSKVGVNDWYIISSVPLSAISSQSENLLKILSLLTFILILTITVVSIIINYILRRRNKMLEKFAYYDRITEFSNWEKFMIDGKKILLQNPSINYSIISIDMNKFKIINDIFSFEEGNNVLKFVAKTIDNILIENEIFCRVSSDNFAILMKYENDDLIIKRLKEIIKKIRHYFSTYKIDCSVGIYTIADKYIDIEILYDRANISRIIAKNKIDEWYHCFKEENRLEILKENEIENTMHQALASGEFEVYLQPKYSLKTEKLCGTEALVRWNKHNIGIIKPSEFIPIFEGNGFIRELDLYVFESVCKVISGWKKLPLSALPIPVSVNISRVNLSNNNLARKLKKIAQKYNIETSLIEIEFTESSIFANLDNNLTIIRKIKNEGFLISIDDFGNGYSSYSTIKNVPADFIKIDKSFVDDISVNKRSEDIVCNIVSLIKLLGSTSVAEGVETESQISLLKNAGCDIAQGYYYSEPITVAEFEKLILE